MAIDFSQVKALSIPEGNVISISSGGVVIWTSGPRLTSITLSGYNSSLSINTTFIYGGTVTAHYSDNTTADVTLSTTFTGYNMATAGSQTVTASYTEDGITKTATYTLNVVAVGWHTIWEGEATISNKKGTVTGNTNNLCESASGTGLTPKIRVTFSWPSGATNNSTGGSFTAYYYTNGSGSSTAPTSPVEMTTTDAQNISLVGRYNQFYPDYNRREIRYVALQKTNSGTDHVIFKLAGWSTTGSSMGTPSVYTSMTITKIEQYY